MPSGSSSSATPVTACSTSAPTTTTCTAAWTPNRWRRRQAGSSGLLHGYDGVLTSEGVGHVLLRRPVVFPARSVDEIPVAVPAAFP